MVMEIEMQSELESEKVSSKISQNPTWYKALTLAERAATLTDLERYHDFDRALAEAEFKRWKEQKPFDKAAYFADRLNVAHVDRADLLYLLGESAETLQKRWPNLPAWLQNFSQFFETETETKTENSQQAQFDFSNILTKESQTEILKILQPILETSLARLQAGINMLVQSNSFSRSDLALPFDPQHISRQLFSNLPAQLMPKFLRTLVLELNVARLENRLQGDTPASRFESFIQLGQQPGWLLNMLSDYPVMARQLVVTIENWLNFSLEFLKHLCLDWADICDTFSLGQAPGLLREVVGGQGDSHKQGRSVLKLKFSQGLQLLYKPKSLAVDVHFQELLDWLNQHATGQQPQFRLLRLLDRGSYGWSEFIKSQECQTDTEVERFYRRQGSYLALLYAIDAVDFHSENLIAAGEYPILIDLEALFHPHFEPTQPDGSSQASNLLNYSVLRTSLLPMQIMGDKDSPGIDISGLTGGKEGQLTPRPVSSWQAVGTDQMRIVKQRIAMQQTDNLPKLNGKNIDTLAYSKSIMKGFVHMYDLLIQYRAELLAGPIARFAQDEIRVIVRPTQLYARLLQESYHPDMLHDALERDRFFDRLWLPIEQQPELAKVIGYEMSDLNTGDIPMFTARPNDRHIYSSNGECIPNFLAEAGMTAVHKRFQQLSQADLKRQKWFIEAAFATVNADNDQYSTLSSLQGISQNKLSPASPAKLKAAALKVGKRIAELALHDEKGGVSWVGLTLINERTWTITPAGWDLYDGTPGIILFLAYLGHSTNQKQFTELAKQGFETLQRELKAASTQLRQIGFFSGWAGLIYLYTHLAKLWSDPSLYQEVETLMLPPIKNLIEEDKALDIIGGAAGCIVSLLDFHQAYPSPAALEIAKLGGEHLVAKAKIQSTDLGNGVGWLSPVATLAPLAGFSHGAAGMALALLKLNAVMPNQTFETTARAALTYERSLFADSENNWPDLRDAEGKTEPTFMSAWCHGAPGIGLSRIGLLELVDDPNFQPEIEVAIKTTLAEGFGMNHSACHGDLGNLELILVASQHPKLLSNQAALSSQLEYSTTLILASIKQHGWLTGIPLGVEAPGFMTGLAGIGYQLLRLANPRQVPSVLLLEAPR
jgi:type 2 lantibiotic biosynthesis protein LanM